MSARYAGHDCIEPRALWRSSKWARKNAHLWRERANTFRTAIGPLPGVGWVLLRKSQLDAINHLQLQSLRFLGGGSSVTITNLLTLGAYCLAAGFDGDPTAPYVVKVADIRHLCKNTLVNKTYNVRAPAAAQTYYQDSLNAGAAWGWTTLLTNLWDTVLAVVPELGAYPGTPLPVPVANPENVRFHGVSAWDALNDVLRLLGMAFVLNPLTAAASIVKVGDTDPALTAAELKHRALRYDDYAPLEGTLGKAPATVRVYFHRQREEFGTELATGWAAAGQDSVTPLVEVDVATGVAGARAGSVVPLFDDLPAYVNFVNVVVNQADLNARAAERAADYVRALSTGGALMWRQYAGFQPDFAFGPPLKPGYRLSAVAWGDTGTGWMTETLRIPQAHERWDELAKFLDGGHAAVRAGWGQERPNARLVEPDLGRVSYQGVYPMQLQLVYITSGTAVAADVYAASVLLTEPTTPAMFVKEDCYVFTPSGRAYQNADIMLARLSGRFTVGADTRPLYVGESIAGGVVLVKLDVTTPDGNGRYDAKEQSYAGNGAWTDGIDCWVVEGNSAGVLVLNERYLAKHVGFENGRPVYALCDFNLSIKNQGLGTSFARTFSAEFGPDNCWNITQPAARRALLKRILDIYEGTTLRMDFAKKLVFKSAADPLEDDFDLTAGAAGSGDINEIAQAGHTGAYDLLTRCVSGVLKKRTFTWRRGSLKAVSAETDA